MESVASFVIHLISDLGYPGIILAMAIESALIPLPSEIIMPFSGYLVSTGRFDFALVVLCGAVGNLLGSILAYALGYWGQEVVVRRLVRRFGKFILLTEDEFDHAQHLLQRFQDFVVFASRLIPGIRTVISLPCGIARLSFIRFCVLSFLGSAIWSAFLTWIGVTLGVHWDAMEPIFRRLDVVIVAVILLLVGFYVWYKLRRRSA